MTCFFFNGKIVFFFSQFIKLLELSVLLLLTKTKTIKAMFL